MATSKHPEMEHRTGAVNQSARDNPLTGSALQALVRGWIAGTAGLPGDMEGLARKGINFSFGPGGVSVNPDSALPTTDFYKEWLPGKQVGDENVTEVGSLFGGVGATKPVSLAKGALTRVAQAAPGPLAGTRAAMKGVIKAPGGNWLSGSVEDALRGLKQSPIPGDAVPIERGLNGDGTPLGADLIARLKANGNAFMDNETGELFRAPGPLDSFIDKQLTRYVKNDMATERDPIRALAERGTLHIPHEEVGMNRHKAPDVRSALGFPREGSGKSEAAQAWEAASDTMLKQKPASYYQQGIGNVDEWLTKVPPQTPIHEANSTAGANLGFDHLIDELRNATNPQSGLPANLLLRPESLDRVSVPQAVEHVAKINAWREAQKIEANQAIANNAATVLHKEYADAATNPKGLRWVELKKTPGKADRAKELGSAADDPFAPKSSALDDEASYKSLQDALKYEGDTMGHCVGGYCDDVANGSSRIFSLRDAKGQPHVTIEAAPARSNKISDMNAGTPTDYNIVQIKGKSKKKPNDEYLPFVQDFVRSGKWSDVGDFQNAGLIKRSNLLEKEQALRPELGDYLTIEEIQKMREAKPWTPIDTDPAFATGGSVTAGPWWDSYQSGPPDEQPTKTALPTLTLEDFRARISPNMLDAEGRFKAPAAGVNYMLEGLTPEQAYSSAQAQTRYNGDGEWVADYQNPARAQMLDPSWRSGPNNGGGFLGGLGTAAQGMFDGVRTNPAIMAALTAGVGSSFNPAISEGLQSAGMSANAAKTAAPMVLNAGKTVLSGGSLADAAKGAAVGYAGGEIGGAVKDTTGSDFMGNAARTLTQTALNGGSLSIDELAAQYASGKLTDLSGLPPQVASIVVNLARNRKTTPGAMVGALSQVARKAS